MSTPKKGEEHSTKLLKSFIQEAEQEMNATLELAVEGEAYNMGFVDIYK